MTTPDASPNTLISSTGPLISVDELALELAGPTPPLLLDVRYELGRDGGEEVFAAGHIPGARWVDLEHELSAHDDRAPDNKIEGGRHPLPSAEQFSRAMRRVGVDATRPVVVCDGNNSLAAGRLWWMLRDAGHPAVRVLDGGFAAWQGKDGDVEVGCGTPGWSAGDFEAVPGHLPRVDADQVAALGTAEGTVWDVRAPERFRGEVEPIDPVAGHIPGARNLPGAANHQSDGRFRSPAELAARLGEVSAGDIVYYGSGITAAQTLLALEIAGIPGAKLYAGSWSDWISDPNRPVATGEG